MFPGNKLDLGRSVRLVAEDGLCSVYKIQNSTGEGMMTCYGLLPGIVLMHCDIHIRKREQIRGGFRARMGKSPSEYRNQAHGARTGRQTGEQV